MTTCWECSATPPWTLRRCGRVGPDGFYPVPMTLLQRERLAATLDVAGGKDRGTTP